MILLWLLQHHLKFRMQYAVQVMAGTVHEVVFQHLKQINWQHSTFYGSA